MTETEHKEIITRIAERLDWARDTRETIRAGMRRTMWITILIVLFHALVLIIARSTFADSAFYDVLSTAGTMTMSMLYAFFFFKLGNAAGREVSMQIIEGDLQKDLALLEAEPKKDDPCADALPYHL